MRPEFETVSLQRAAHAQQRSNSIHAEPFSSTLNFKKIKKDSTGRAVESIILLFRSPRVALGKEGQTFAV